MSILVQLFWICLAVLESDYEHEFLLGLRLLDQILQKLPLGKYNFGISRHYFVFQVVTDPT